MLASLVKRPCSTSFTGTQALTFKSKMGYLGTILGGVRRGVSEIFAVVWLAPMQVLKAATWDAVYALRRTDQSSKLPNSAASTVTRTRPPPISAAFCKFVKADVILDRGKQLMPLVGE
jgi:hypothetical protein